MGTWMKVATSIWCCISLHRMRGLPVAIGTAASVELLNGTSASWAVKGDGVAVSLIIQLIIKYSLTGFSGRT